MSGLDIIKEDYSRRARLYPALIVLIPIAVAVLVLFPQLHTRTTALASMMASFGGLMFLTQLGRDRGKALEPQLFVNSGGKPSVRLLRHSDGTLTGIQKQRYKRYLSEELGVAAPTVEEERNDPESADAWYESATRLLLAKTRDTKKFRLLFEENVNYGFRRNLYGLKPAAVGAGCAVALLAVADAAFAYYRDGSAPTGGMIGAALICIAYVLLFLLVVKPAWVQVPSVAYANRLLEACDTSPTRKKASSAKSKKK